MNRPTRRDARLERQNAKAVKAAAKSVRIRETVEAERLPRAGADPGSIYSLQMTWTCDDPDCAGAWSWGIDRQWADEDWTGVILPKLTEFSRLTWAEIDTFSSDAGHKMHHNMQTEIINEEAQLRLIEIDKYGEVIFRFRLGNKKRLWGFRIAATFEVLWFDPTHQVYPTDPD